MLKNAERIRIMHFKTRMCQCQRLCMARVEGKKQVPSQPYHAVRARSSMRWRGSYTGGSAGAPVRVLRYHLPLASRAHIPHHHCHTAHLFMGFWTNC
jgi:hypothetical protein